MSLLGSGAQPQFLPLSVVCIYLWGTGNPTHFSANQIQDTTHTATGLRTLRTFLGSVSLYKSTYLLEFHYDYYIYACKIGTV
jgi:hypothetical protein